MYTFSRFLSLNSALACGFVLSSCATNPIYSEFKADETATIVRALRCEVREALYNQMENVFRKRDPRLFEGRLADRASRNLYFSNLKPWDVDPASAMLIMRYYASGISYKITLDIKDEDKSSLNWTLTKNSRIQNQSTKLMPSININQTRQGERKFGFSENLGDYQSINCTPSLSETDRDLLYPIKGRIGIEGTINAYIGLSSISKQNLLIYELSSHQDIASAGTLLQPEENEPIVMTDTLTFTTVMGGQIDPTLVFAPVTAVWRSTGLAGSLGRTRTSMHKISVGIAEPKQLKPQNVFIKQLDCLKRSPKLPKGWEDTLYKDGPDACRTSPAGRLPRSASTSSATTESRNAAREAIKDLDSLEILSRSLAEELQ